jgi:transketolase
MVMLDSPYCETLETAVFSTLVLDCHWWFCCINYPNYQNMNAPLHSPAQIAIDTIRTLSMDGVQAANSGHPGTPMALAPVAYQIWTDAMRYDPAQPLWPNRDRFVLSCGHASMLLYSMIHLAGIKQVDAHGKVTGDEAISLESIKKFRQLHSPCAGHPEYGYASGIETTTGPLGQGVGNAVGMAIAGKHLGAKYNRPGFELFDYDVYALCSDGDLMEGVAAEAASIAGHLGLSNLCWIYDDNGITIEGHTDLAFSESVGKRFQGLGWHTVEVSDANDLGALKKAFDSFKATKDKPTLIIVKSIIGYGSPNKANTHGAHGAPLGDDEIKLTKKAYGWPDDQKFYVPDVARKVFDDTIGANGAKASKSWFSLFTEYASKFPSEAAEIQSMIDRKLPKGWEAGLKPFAADPKGLATRVSSGKVLNMLAPNIPGLIGGSADLAPSTMTLLDGQGDFGSKNFAGRNMHFGIREHGMASVLNGMSLSGLRAYGATFFVFTDYMRPSMRLSSIMHQPVLYVLTHDSIGLGEDGPTHQPVEHLAACRAIPGLYVFRPGDANEVLHCYKAAMLLDKHPTAMVLSRQNVPTLDRTKYKDAAGCEKGAYVLSDCVGQPKALILGTGSEIPICLKAQELLASMGIATRVISVPCMELFDDQDAAYRSSVLPREITARVACEAGIRQGWDKYIGAEGKFVGMSTFGASAPFNQLYDHFKITADHIVEQVKSLLDA